MRRVKLRLWKIYAPVEEEEYFGCRWELRCKHFAVYSENVYTMASNAERAAQDFANRHFMDIISTHIDIRHNVEFLA